jgi:hypothetical protein
MITSTSFSAAGDGCGAVYLEDTFHWLYLHLLIAIDKAFSGRKGEMLRIAAFSTTYMIID